MIQTFQPEHYSLKNTITHDYEKFAETELQHREGLHYPPFSRLAQIRFSGTKLNEVEKRAKEMKKFLDKIAEGKFQLLGPAPAPLTKVRGQYRWLILIKSPHSKSLQWLLNHVVKYSQNAPGKIQTIIDVDSLQML